MAKILIPTDGSEISMRAVKHGLELAKKLDAEVVALFVIDTRTFPGTHPIVPESMAPHYFSLLDEMRKAGATAAKEVVDEGAKVGVTVKSEVVEGLPSVCILDCAKNLKVDMIVMGTHGRSSFAALLLGSTAQAVIHGAKVPVTLVR